MRYDPALQSSEFECSRHSGWNQAHCRFPSPNCPDPSFPPAVGCTRRGETAGVGASGADRNKGDVAGDGPGVLSCHFVRPLPSCPEELRPQQYAAAPVVMAQLKLFPGCINMKLRPPLIRTCVAWAVRANSGSRHRYCRLAIHPGSVVSAKPQVWALSNPHRRDGDFDRCLNRNQAVVLSSCRQFPPKLL